MTIGKTVGMYVQSWEHDLSKDELDTVLYTLVFQ